VWSIARAEPYAGLPAKLRLLFHYRDAGLSGWLADASLAVRYHLSARRDGG